MDEKMGETGLFMRHELIDRHFAYFARKMILLAVV
jgi:hypothetical protein